MWNENSEVEERCERCGKRLTNINIGTYGDKCEECENDETKSTI
jgi:hypothetical protein